MSTNGKGDRSRVNDIKRYRKNFDAIDWKKKRPGDVSLLDFAGRWSWISRGKFPESCK